MDDIAKERFSAGVMIIFVLSLVVFCYIASLTSPQPQKPTVVSCMDGNIHIEKEDGVFVPLELDGKPVKCERIIVK